MSENMTLAVLLSPFSFEQEETDDLTFFPAQPSLKFVRFLLDWEFAIGRLRGVTEEDIESRETIPDAHIVKNHSIVLVVRSRMTVPASWEFLVSGPACIDVEDVLVGQFDEIADFHADVEQLFENILVAPFFQIEEQDSGIEILIVVGQRKPFYMSHVDIFVGNSRDKGAV